MPKSTPTPKRTPGSSKNRPLYISKVDRDNTGRTIAGASMIVAALAFFFSMYQFYCSDRQYKVSVRPYVYLRWYTDTDVSGVYIVNSSNQPAIIDDAALYVDNTNPHYPTSDWIYQKWYQNDGYPKFNYMGHFVGWKSAGFGKNAILAPNTNDALLVLNNNKSLKLRKLHEGFFMHNFQFEIIYSSIANETWRYQWDYRYQHTDPNLPLDKTIFKRVQGPSHYE